MMEALAIGLGLLAGYSVAATVVARYWWRRSKLYAKALVEMADQRDALRAQIAPFDHDGDGRPGGSKPRGKG